jgi:hypothetical protein
VKHWFKNVADNIYIYPKSAPRNLILQTRTSDCNSAKKNTMLEMLMNLQVFSAIVLLSVSFLVVSFVCSNKVCAICALANLAVYLIVLAIDKELSIGNIIIHYQDLYYYIVLVLGYMVMAKCIRKE